MIEELNNWIKSLGIKDYDDLRPDEKDKYLELLNIAESSKIGIEDIIKHIHEMRLSVEFSLATDKLEKNEDLFLKARLKNYILLESLFERPQRAKQLINMYTKKKIGGVI